MTNDVKDILLHKFYKLMYYPSQKKKKFKHLLRCRSDTNHIYYHLSFTYIIKLVLIL